MSNENDDEESLPRPPNETDGLLGNAAGGNETNNDDEEGGGLMETIVENVQHTVETIQDAAQETVEHVQDAMQEAAQDFREDFQTEVKELADVVEEQLHEVDEDELPVLDMALVRQLSLLPSDIVQVAAAIPETDEVPLRESQALMPGEDQTDLEHHVHLPVNEPTAATSTPIMAYVILALATYGLSSGGPLLAFQHGCSPLMKVVWRQNGTVLILVPFLYGDLKNNGWPMSKLSCPQWSAFLFASAAYASANVCFVQALEYTTVGNAVIFANSQAIILLVGKALTGTPTTWLEVFGAFTAFGGAILCSHDGASSDDADSAGTAVLGDVIALGAGLSGVAYLIFAGASRQHFSLFMLMFLTMITSTIMIILFQLIALGEEVELGRNPEVGIWGFLSVDRFDRFPLEFINVVVCNIFGAFGYVMAMQYFDNLVIAVAGLMQPVLATFTAFFIGVGLLPSIMGWIGNALVAGGTFAVVYKPPAQPTTTKSYEVVKKSLDDDDV